MTTHVVTRDRALSARRMFFGPVTRVLNPTIRRVAGRRGVPLLGLVYHRGRRSGRVYASPVMVGSTGLVFMIALTFGSTSDWCRNVLDAGGCEVKLQGVEYAADQAQVVDDRTASVDVNAAFALPFRFMLRALGIRHFLRLRIEPRA